jgi:hypothetical protein
VIQVPVGVYCTSRYPSHTILRPMRHLALFLAAIALIGTDASAQTRQVMPSGRATTQVTLADPRENPPDPIAPATITIDYGQPHLRGRRLHTDTLVPYDSPWRTGANAATKLTTEVDITLGGATVPKGTYYILTHPSRAGWKLSLHRDDPLASQNAAEFARIDLRRRELPAPIESLTITLVPSRSAGPPRGELRIMWDTTELATDWSVR